MDEKLKKLYEALAASYEMPAYDDFVSSLSQPEKLKQSYDFAKENFQDVGTIEDFKQSLFPEKKNLGVTGSGLSSSTPEPAPTAAKRFRDESLRPGRNRTFTSPNQSVYQLTVTDVHQAKESAALQSKVKSTLNIKERRGDNYEDDAVELNKMPDAPPTPLEAMYRSWWQFKEGTKQMADDLTGEDVPLPEQKTRGDYERVFTSIMRENNEIIDAIDVYDQEAERLLGDKYNQLDDLVFQSENLKAQIDGSDLDNAEKNALILQYNDLVGQIKEVTDSEPVKEIQKLSKLYEKNYERFKSEMASGSYELAKDYLDMLAMAQKEKDEEMKSKGVAGRVLSNTGDILLKTLVKIPASAATLAGTIGKAAGSEGDLTGTLQWLGTGIQQDIQEVIPAPSTAHRGFMTTTAKWQKDETVYDVDFDKDGNIQTIRDQGGFVVDGDLTAEDKDEIRRLPKESQFNFKPLPYQIGETVADLGVQIMGTKGLAVAGRAKAASEAVGFIATNTALMAGDLYQDGIQNGLSEDEAARYALSVGAGIGAMNLLTGFGAEANILGKGTITDILKKKGFAVPKYMGPVAGAAGEAFEEVGLEKMLEIGIQYLYNQGSGQFKLDQFADKNALISEAAVAAIVGGLADMVKSDRPNAMHNMITTEASKDVETTMEAVRASAEELGLLPEEVDEIEMRLREFQAAQAKVPDDMKNNHRVIEAITEKARLDAEAKIIEGEKRELEESFHGPLNERLAEIEQQKKAHDETIRQEIEALRVGEDVVEDADVAEPTTRERQPKQKPTFTYNGFEVNEDTKEVHKVGKPSEKATPAQKRAVMKVYADNRIDEFATTGEKTENVMESTSPVQVAEEWMNTPEFETEIFTKKFDSIEDVPEELRLNAVEVEGGVQIRISPETAQQFGLRPPKNPVKRELAKKFKELTGVTLTEKYADRLSTRAEALQGVPPPVTYNRVDQPREGKLRGFFANSLKKAQGQSLGKKLLNRIAEANPEYYKTMKIQQFADQMQAEIDENGIEWAISRSKDTDEGLEMTARRVMTLIALGDMLAEANRAGDMKAVDELAAAARAIEERIARRGTSTGQENAFLAYYSMTPEGQLARVVRKVSERREQMRRSGNEQGRAVGEVVDSIVADVAAEMRVSNQEALEAIREAFGVVAESQAAKGKIKAGQEKVKKAKKDLVKALMGSASSSLFAPVNKDVAKALSDMFVGLAEQFQGNLTLIKGRIKREVKEANDASGKSLSFDEVWDFLRVKHGDTIDSLQDFEQKIAKAVVGFYNGDLEGELSAILAKEGISIDVADAVTEAIAKKKRQRIALLIRKNEKSEKKAKVIESKLAELLLSGALDEETTRKAIEEKYGIKSFSNEDLGVLNEMILDVKTLPGERMKKRKMQEVLDYVQSVKGEDTLDIIHSVWYAAVLFEIKTWGSILIGNFLNFVNYFVYYGLFTQGGRYAMANSISRLFNPGSGRGLWFGMAEAANFVRYGNGYKTMDKIVKNSALERIAKTHSSKVIRGMARAATISTRMLSAMDAINYYSSYAFHMDRLAYQSALAEGLSGTEARKRAEEIVAAKKESRDADVQEARRELEEYAAKKGQTFEELFTDRDALYRAIELSEQRLGEGQSGTAKILSEEIALQNAPRGLWGYLVTQFGQMTSAYNEEAIDQDIEKTGNSFMDKVGRGTRNVVKVWANWMFPFLKTTANSVNIAVDFFPALGYAQKRFIDVAFTPTVDFSKNEKGELNNPDDVNVFLARQLTGTALLTLWLLATSDDEDDIPMITGAGAKDWNIKKQEYERGWRPFTIRAFGKNWYYRDSALGILFSFIGAVNDAKRYAKDGEESYEFSDAMMVGIAGYFTNASFLQTFNDLTESIVRADASKFGEALLRPITGFTNSGIARWIDRVVSPEIRERRTYESKILGAVLSNTMILNNLALELKYNSLGEPIDPYKNMTAFAQFTGWDKYISDAGAYNEIFDVMADKGVYFTKVSERTQMLDKSEMTREEFLYFSLAIGRYRKMVLADSLDKMREMTPEQLKQEITSLDQNAKKVAKVLTYEASQNNALSLDPATIDRALSDGKDAIIDRYHQVNDMLDMEDEQIEVPDNLILEQ